jgi:DNA-binding NarL/FixJ family response regulator
MSASAQGAGLDAHGTGQHAAMTTAGLTSREREVLRLIAAGSNKEIAVALFIAPKTASAHVSNILGKLGDSSRTEAAAIAHRDGIASACFRALDGR